MIGSIVDASRGYVTFVTAGDDPMEGLRRSLALHDPGARANRQVEIRCDRPLLDALIAADKDAFVENPYETHFTHTFEDVPIRVIGEGTD